ncbi:DUF4105 domain-containing protein [Maribacter sp. 2-571]|uniref:lipoprotein N-acyltransferase Lnb domain-containing protein n=1 Tax=Maribacter sp. 2-571 TaxID=3417569 RepID=UPI003D34C98D
MTSPGTLIRIKTFLFTTFLLIAATVYAQKPVLSPLSEISVLTVGNGDDLYSKFGHSAIRVHDPSVNFDIVYNYGLFDFDDPLFYTKFTKGQLDYRLGKQRFKNFVFGYELENRSVTEQVLKLDNAQTKALFDFLENNYKPENRYYRYDFLFDNCATRIPDALKSVLGEAWQLRYGHIREPISFRGMINEKLEVNRWFTFGINTALGAVIDEEVTPWERLFLPAYLFHQLPNTTLWGKPLVSKEIELVRPRPTATTTLFFMTPMFWFGLLFLASCWITYRNISNGSRSRWLDFLLALASGVTGCILFFLWFLSDHQATKMNFNTFWAFGPNVIIAFVMLKRTLPKWIRTYTWFLIALLLSVLLIWVFGVQQFSPIVLFPIGTLLLRYLFLIRYTAPGKDRNASEIDQSPNRPAIV